MICSSFTLPLPLQSSNVRPLLIIAINSMKNQGSRRPKFEEQFQDSEANHSEAYEARPQGQENVGEAVQLIRIRPNGKIEVVEQALNLLAQYNVPVGFVSLVGKMRTGKSCLLNRLLQLTGKGFKVDPSVSSCTQGIWMWSEPLFNPAQNNYIFVLDTEGTDSLEKDAQNDTKIFTIALLLASYFIYNSVGSIDERSLSELQMVTALSKTIKADNKLTERDNQESLYRFMPRFLWVLRDFTLKIEDQRGRKISPTKYLENCLQDQSGIQREDSRKIKRSIINYFKDRECVTLVRPIGDELELQKMNSIPDHALRREFIEGVNNLRELILRNTGPKTYEGEILTGPAIASMVENYAEAFNSGGVPNIKSAWQQIAQDEGAAAFNRALERYEQVFKEEFPDDSPKGEEIYRIVNRLKDEAIKQFQANSFGSVNKEYLGKLEGMLKQKEEKILQINNNVNEVRNHEILKKHAQKLKTKLESGRYKGKKEDMSADINEIVKNYNAEARGQSKGEILTEFLANLNPVLLSLDQDTAAHEQEIRLAKQKEIQLQKRNQMAAQENQSLRKQLQAMKRADELKTGGKKKDSKGDDKNRKQANSGCCSGDKCQIM